MVKKTALIGLFLLVILVPATFATGIGFVVGEPTGLSVNFDNPFVLGVGWSFYSKDASRVDLTLDYWLLDKDLSGSFDWYLGVGGKAGLFLDNNSSSDNFYIAFRVPIGIQWWITNEIEFFAEIAPGFAILPASDLDIGAGLGLRFHLF